MIILNYHEISDEPGRDRWTVSSSRFKSHLDLFRDRLISPETFLNHCHSRNHDKDGRVLLTFDDGRLSDYTVAFEEYFGSGEIPGFMSFIPTDLVGKPGHMNWQMIKELASHGITVGSHGLAHVDLTALSDVDLENEVRTSKSVLEDKTGSSVKLFAFPFGRFDKRVWNAALAAGYTHLFTIQLGHHRSFETFLYSRLCITTSIDSNYMARHLANPDEYRGMAWRMSNRLGIYRLLMRLRYH
ncbi:Peptidoglycan/xylan/chitin deacetylase, PgdA/CDA1 family [Roseivivax lentus]|uniref:Chitooligosaccharide deacetylase n=1 Tax=Roseivivax lentus TaxID=633194 RepID=A0A1N7P8S1_9RHOB|nr:polysaccharide deacetylase family protein [Roseivivax lentus]SIT06926.1 Peptidoglycan/xylan/chitin deacetylase, PgdA/CDA1 family [Roseivivax lentus]